MVAESIEGNGLVASGTLDGREYLGYARVLNAMIRIEQSHIKKGQRSVKMVSVREWRASVCA